MKLYTFPATLAGLVSCVLSMAAAPGDNPAVPDTTAASGLPPLPAPLAVPHPGPTNDAPYAPQAILPGGVVIPLYQPGSPFLKPERVREPEDTP